MAAKIATKNATKIATPKAPAVVRQNTDWGVRLTLKPFPGDAQYMSLEILAEIANRTETRLPSLKIFFNGPPVTTPFNLSALRVWSDALKIITEDARKVQDELNKKPRTKVRGKKARTG